jgi:hypothetical protein
MDVEGKVGKVQQLKLKIKEIEDRHKAELKPYEDLKLKIENRILEFLNTTNQQNAKTKLGTAYKHEEISYRIDDPDQFKRHVIGSEAWDVINWSVNKTAAKDLFERTKQLYPGTTRSVFVSVHVLAPPKARSKRVVQEEELSPEEWAEIENSLEQEQKAAE